MFFDRPLSRRSFVAAVLTTGPALALAPLGARALAATPGVCRLTPEQEVGPYYLDAALVRRDITEGKPGIPLVLDITLDQFDAGTDADSGEAR